MKTDNTAYRFLEARFPTTGKRRLVVLTGPRQVGKTTLARKAFGGLRYVNLDAAEARDDLEAVRAGQWGTTVGPAILDEVQKAPALFDKIKFAYDERQIDASVLF